MTDCILYFAKYPTPGEVKTRLAADSSMSEAAAFYRLFAADKLREIEAGCDADLIVCYTPAGAKDDMTGWLGDRGRFIAQKGEDLGRRMENAFREAFFLGYDRVVLVGSDIPGLTPEIVNRGLEVLISDRACIGPVTDGGYYLIGFHRYGFVPEIFHDMVWSADTVFQSTCNRFEIMDMQWTNLEMLSDVDTLDDVRKLIELGDEGPLGGKTLALAKRLVGV